MEKEVRMDESLSCSTSDLFAAYYLGGEIFSDGEDGPLSRTMRPNAVLQLQSESWSDAQL